MKPQLIREVKNEWIVHYPKCVDENFEEYWDSIDQINSNPKEAEKGLKSVIKKCNCYIDAVLHLGFLYNDIGKEIEGNALIYKAHLIALEAIPDEFDEKKDRITWAIIENRPFLRTFQGVILEMMKYSDYENAIRKCRFVLNVNPNDNQGIRYLLLENYFYNKEPENILKLIKEYKEEASAEFLYGLVLAYLQLNSPKKAKAALQKAIGNYPKIGKEIIKKRHREPKNEAVYGGIIMGSDYQAYDYWLRNKAFWKETNGAIEFIREEVK